LCTLAFVLVVSTCFSARAQAQASIQQCSALLRQITTAIQNDSSKQLVLLERQNLTWCRQFFDGGAYEHHLNTLASALIEDRQFSEAIGVADKCLQSDPENLPCLARKAEALLRNNNVAQSKTVVERAARLGAVSEFDVLAKKNLARLSEEIHAEETRMAAATSAGLPKAGVPVGVENRDRVKMVESGGVYHVPVVINDALKLDFTVDSGAADVSIPSDVVLTLTRTGTIKKSDFIGTETYRLADGSAVSSRTFIIRSLKVGDRTVTDVRASIADVSGPLLLGQSFLKRFKSWSQDNAAHELVLQ
jgi:predicted aspartyl protease